MPRVLKVALVVANHSVVVTVIATAAAATKVAQPSASKSRHSAPVATKALHRALRLRRDKTKASRRVATMRSRLAPSKTRVTILASHHVKKAATSPVKTSRSRHVRRATLQARLTALPLSVLRMVTLQPVPTKMLAAAQQAAPPKALVASNQHVRARVVSAADLTLTEVLKLKKPAQAGFFSAAIRMLAAFTSRR